MGRTTNEIRKEIQKREKKLERPLEESEKKRIIKRVTKQVRRQNLIRGTLVALGITMGAGGYALLTSGDDKPKEGNKTQTETQIDTETERNEFVSGLNVEVSPLIPKENIQIKDSVEKDIEALQTPEEVLDYVKEIYINEYNEQNGENYTAEQVKFYKSRIDEVYRDTATNGDQIMRRGDKEEGAIDTTKGVITAYIENEDEKIIQRIVNYYNEYKTLYSRDEIVDKYEDNFLVDMAPVVDAGIDWAAAIDEKETWSNVKQKYQDRLTNAIINYKTEKINSNEQLQDQEYEQE